MKSGTSVGANYRAVCRARSNNEFIAKLGVVIEEADETAFWLEIIIESKILKAELVKSLLNEANEIVAIMVTSKITSSRIKNGENI
ncbi:MAG: four helix bundle protein [Patescibacteria group bacterium]